MTVIYVALGGALGAVLRYWFALVLSFPFGTLAVNVIGCFAMGVAMVGLLEFNKHLGAWAPLVMTGILGGFTTYSAFALDTLRLYEAGEALAAAAYALGTFILAIAAIFLGVAMGRGLFS
ncbi:MAG: CrcB family protein [Pseudomonadota bacterium]